MACCTMQAEDAALPRGDTEDTEVYRKHGEEDSECQIIEPDKVNSLFLIRGSGIIYVQYIMFK